MELTELIEALSDPAPTRHPVDAVEVRQTHISVVFLAGPYAYKIKKPVDLGFLDYSTLGAASALLRARRSPSTAAWRRRSTSASSPWPGTARPSAWRARARRSSGP